MKWAARVVRVLVGVAFVVFGLDYFLHFIPKPENIELPQAGKDLMSALVPTRYMDVVKVLEIVGGLLVLSGRLTPLGLIVLVPVTVNIALWDALIMHYSGPPIGTVLLLMQVFLIVAYRRHFAGVWSANATVG
jgi:uncharacterized membrane protein YphA (DoxX/SURF4 family)